MTEEAALFHFLLSLCLKTLSNGDLHSLFCYLSFKIVFYSFSQYSFCYINYLQCLVEDAGGEVGINGVCPAPIIICLNDASILFPHPVTECCLPSVAI